MSTRSRLHSPLLVHFRSLSEVPSIILALEDKGNHLSLKVFPKRSTISDANECRRFCNNPGS